MGGGICISGKDDKLRDMRCQCKYWVRYEIFDAYSIMLYKCSYIKPFAAR